MKKLIVLIVLVIAAALVFWFFYPIRSMIVMSIYSGQHESESVMARGGFDIEMPSGNGWYPFVMTYNAHGFESWSGVDADMSIMYNFGAFDAATRTSSLYDPDSDHYSSFYGAYAVRSGEGIFGFDEAGQIDMNESHGRLLPLPLSGAPSLPSPSASLANSQLAHRSSTHRAAWQRPLLPEQSWRLW